MSAYVILDIIVNDPVRYEEYKKLATPSIMAYGGKYLARGGHSENLEGDWEPNRVVMLEFASVEAAKTWLKSPEYTTASAIRHDVATSKAIVVEGI